VSVGYRSVFGLARLADITANHPVLQQLCNNMGVDLAFLPLYSPDFNPIEKSFAKMKA